MGAIYDKEGRYCRKCGEYKKYSEYHRHAGCPNGFNSVCKECRKPVSAAAYERESLEYRLWYRARRRAKTKQVPFTINPEDIEIPEICPIMGTPLEVPSLDRHNPKLGYVKGNIVVMSNRANMLKNDASIEELEKVLRYLKNTKGGACEL